MSNPQITRPDPVGPDGWPFVEQSMEASPPPIGVVRRILQAFTAIVGVQILAAFVILLITTSYRRASAEWLLPLIGVVDLLVTLQIGWLAIRDIRLAGRRTAGPRYALTFLVLLLVAGVGAGGLAVRQYLGRPVPGALDAPVMDGDLRFSASAPECGGKTKKLRIEGTMCLVRLTAANTGATEARVEARVQRLRGEDGDHRGVTLAAGRRFRTSWTLRAGASVRGTLVFDVPRGFAPHSLELRAAEGGRGVRLPIP
ncbi:DUF4352 domain-containing protein [Actinomadura sp. LOL_016]|uniref:DUF4352 domain-containing protein n=1 Tax=unclassified Actinomadura TaxID=2626254 RepID=UPI003A80D5B0